MKNCIIIILLFISLLSCKTLNDSSIENEKKVYIKEPIKLNSFVNGKIGENIYNLNGYSKVIYSKEKKYVTISVSDSKENYYNGENTWIIILFILKEGEYKLDSTAPPKFGVLYYITTKPNEESYKTHINYLKITINKLELKRNGNIIGKFEGKTNHIIGEEMVEVGLPLSGEFNVNIDIIE